MSQYLSLSRAARLANISRGQLQARIRELALETFEGQLSLETLLEAYPDIDTDNDPVFEKVRRIKNNARPKSRYTDNWTPEPEVLYARLHDFRHVLARTQTTVNSLESILREVTDELNDILKSSDQDMRSAISELTDRLQKSIDKADKKVDRKAELFAKDAVLRFMSASVRLTPSGHEFFVEGKDTLLDAAIKAGLHLNYGCASGNCGKCKVRVIRGRISPTREHDFVLSETDKQKGYCLACSNTAVSDVLLEAEEAIKPADLPEQEIRCVVKKFAPLSDAFALLTIQTPKTKTLRFMAGQQISVTLENGLQRTLALAGCPCDGHNLQILLNTNDAGFSQQLAANEQRQTVLIKGPYGDFLLHEDSMDPIVFITVNEGFGPVKSLIEHSISIDIASSMYLYRVDPLPPASMVGNLCRSWDDALDNFVYQRLDAGLDAEAVLQKIKLTLGKMDKQHYYVAAPQAWLDDFQQQAGKFSIPAERILYYACQ